jgi:galactonate dehydratase
LKITALKTFLVPPRWLFLKIETDEGISGWGEPVLEGRALTLAALVDEMSDFLIGRDPRRINDIWQTLYRNGCYRGGPVLMSAISGIDTALWDILGKYHDAPIHALLGGTQRERIKAYIWIGGDRPHNYVADALAARERGFSAVKMNICEELTILDSFKQVDAIVGKLSVLRSSVGNTIDLAFDFHGRVHAPMARVLLRELEPLRPLFVEDAVAPGTRSAYGVIARDLHPARGRRADAFSRRVQGDVRGARRAIDQSRSTACRRHQRDDPHRRDGGSLRCRAGAALSAGADRARGVPAN